MALLDEGKLQGNITKILNILEKEAVCCSIVSAQWMCDADSGTAVWVTINESGAIVVYDAPGGVVINPVGPLGPVDSSGNCPQPIFVPAVDVTILSQDACKLLDQEQYITLSFTSNIPTGVYRLEAFIAGVWTQVAPLFFFIGPGTYGPVNDIQIVPYQNFEGDQFLRLVEVGTNTISNIRTEDFVTCVP